MILWLEYYNIPLSFLTDLMLTDSYEKNMNGWGIKSTFRKCSYLQPIVLLNPRSSPCSKHVNFFLPFPYFSCLVALRAFSSFNSIRLYHVYCKYQQNKNPWKIVNYITCEGKFNLAVKLCFYHRSLRYNLQCPSYRLTMRKPPDKKSLMHFVHRYIIQPLFRYFPSQVYLLPA